MQVIDEELEEMPDEPEEEEVNERYTWIHLVTLLCHCFLTFC